MGGTSAGEGGLGLGTSASIRPDEGKGKSARASVGLPLPSRPCHPAALPSCRPAPYAAVPLSAVVGSMIVFTETTWVAGKPPRLACSRTTSSFGAM